MTEVEVPSGEVKPLEFGLDRLSADPSVQVLDMSGAEVEFTAELVDGWKLSKPFVLHDDSAAPRYRVLARAESSSFLGGPVYEIRVVEQQGDGSLVTVISRSGIHNMETDKSISFQPAGESEPVELRCIDMLGRHERGGQTLPIDTLEEDLFVARRETPGSLSLNVLGFTDRYRRWLGDSALPLVSMGRTPNYAESPSPLFPAEGDSTLDDYAASQIRMSVNRADAHHFGEIQRPWAHLLGEVVASAANDVFGIQLIQKLEGEGGREAALAFVRAQPECVSFSSRVDELRVAQSEPGRDVEVLRVEAIRAFLDFRDLFISLFGDNRMQISGAQSLSTEISDVKAVLAFDVDDWVLSLFKRFSSPESISASRPDTPPRKRVLEERLNVKAAYIQQGLDEMERGAQTGLTAAGEFLDGFEIPELRSRQLVTADLLDRVLRRT